MTNTNNVDPEKAAQFCLSKCGSGYCSYMSGGPGFPCVEFICEFCEGGNCEWCKERR